MATKKSGNEKRRTHNLTATQVEHLIAALQENSKVQMANTAAIEKMVRLIEKRVQQEESHAEKRTS
jgi:hypothetical protein